MAPATSINLDWLFTYHVPKPDQLPKYEKIRKAAKEFAQVILDETPQCADQSHAIRLVRDMMMWANASIACEGSLIGPAEPTPLVSKIVEKENQNG